ncbi:hypothetical protein CHARACLAT_026357 [Characodon lateralis]|uniref:Uncharacterized protein n=1 Tax=Characodon lateralis TaxID=208331 RepID=A0ABU7DM90_9TELE|nr:hypothetical protein [Characodon lateralis]
MIWSSIIDNRFFSALVLHPTSQPHPVPDWLTRRKSRKKFRFFNSSIAPLRLPRRILRTAPLRLRLLRPPHPSHRAAPASLAAPHPPHRAAPTSLAALRPLRLPRCARFACRAAPSASFALRRSAPERAST